MTFEHSNEAFKILLYIHGYDISRFRFANSEQRDEQPNESFPSLRMSSQTRMLRSQTKGRAVGKAAHFHSGLA